MNLNKYETRYALGPKRQNALPEIPEPREEDDFKQILSESIDEKQIVKKKPVFKMPERKKYIGLHSFSRRLYKDVPDMFDVLKKLVFKIQYYLDRVNPEVGFKLLIIYSRLIYLFFFFLTQFKEIIDEIHLEYEENLEKERSKFLPSIYNNYSTRGKSIPEPEYNFYEVSLAKIDLYVDSKSSLNAESSEITWFKWMPDPSCNGMAGIVFLKNENQVDLKYHVADYDNLLKNYLLDEDVINYLCLLKFAFGNYLESSYINVQEINRDNEFFHVNFNHF